MGDILRRRGMMALPSSSPTPEWDVEWDYTMGLPDANGVFTKQTDGTVSATLEENDVKLSVKGTNKYIRYVYPTNYTKGVLEVHFLHGGSSQLYYVFALSADGTNGIAIRCQYSTNYKGIYLATGSDGTIANMTKLSSFPQSTEYTVKLVLDSGYGDVYVNGTQLASNVAIGSACGSSNRVIQFTGASTGTYYGYLYSIKMKLGRTS